MKMSQHRSPLSLLTAALCLLNAAAVDATEAEPKRMLRQRATHNHNEGERNLQLQGGSDNICKSLIAVGGWRRNDVLQEVNQLRFLGHNQNHTLSYADETDPETDEDFVCELYDGSTLPVQATQEQIHQLRSMLNKGQLVSAESTVEAEYVESSSEEEGIASSMTDAPSAPQYVSLPQGTVKVVNGGNADRRQRRLGNNNNMYEGDKQILIVRVTDKDGRAVPEDAEFLSDKFFGTYGDKVTMKSGFNDCSFGKFRVANDYGNQFNNKLFSAEGVIDVDIGIRLTTSTQATIRVNAARAVEKKLGVSLPGPFDHVVFVVESCYQIGTSCQFAAYAYINHWFSFFIEDNYKFPAVTMHELGHNLNLAHSGGLDRRTYTDHTCLMGNPLWEDDVGAMCYNPVKNFQIARAGNAWYGNQHIQAWNSGKDGGTKWSGRLIGVAEYDKAASDSPIVLKLETGTAQDWYLGYNRAVGAHADVVQAGDTVTLYKGLGTDGLGYSTSSLKATIKSGKELTIENWRNTQKNLLIRVNQINTKVSPSYADIEIEFGDATPPPTPNPTKPPTPKPSPEPTSYPTSKPTPSPTKEPTTSSPTQAPTTAAPTGTPSMSPTEAPTTAKPTVSPTLSSSPSTSPPSSSPSSSPTKNPTSSPTTASPTSSPSKQPSKSPTLRPTKHPTSSPTTASPTSSPTKTPNPSAPQYPTKPPTSKPSAPLRVESTLTTGSSTDSNSVGNVFFLTSSSAKIGVEGFSIYGKKDGNSRVTVYVRDVGETFWNGKWKSSDGWETVFDKDVNLKKGQLTYLGDLNKAVSIPPNNKRAFYIYAEKGMLESKGSSSNGRFKSQGALSITRGISTKKLFDKSNSKRQFAGEIHFYEERS